MNAWSPANGLWFSIQIDQDEFLAFVSADALAIHFDADTKATCALQQAYLKNQWIIDETARRKFEGGAHRPVRLSVGDF